MIALNISAHVLYIWIIHMFLECLQLFRKSSVYKMLRNYNREQIMQALMNLKKHPMRQTFPGNHLPVLPRYDILLFMLEIRCFYSIFF